MPRINPENEVRRERRKELSGMLNECGVTDFCAVQKSVQCLQEQGQEKGA